MTTKEFAVESNLIFNEITEHENKVNLLNKKHDTLINDFVQEHRKFKDGDAVVLSGSTSKNPIKYFVQDAIGVVYSKHLDDAYVDIRYHIATKNGKKGNGGWAISESGLTKVA